MCKLRWMSCAWRKGYCLFVCVCECLEQWKNERKNERYCVWTMKFVMVKGEGTENGGDEGLGS